MIRIALLMGPECPPSAIVPLLAAIEQSAVAQVVAVISAPGAAGAKPPTAGLNRLYRVLDEHQHRQRLQQERQVLVELLARVPKVVLPDVSHLQALAPDVVLGWDTGPAELADMARQGLWLLRASAGGMPVPVDSLWRVLDGAPLREITLERRSRSSSAPRVLATAALGPHRRLSTITALRTEATAGAQLVVSSLTQPHCTARSVAVGAPADRDSRPAPVAGDWGRVLRARFRERLTAIREFGRVREWQVGLRRASGALPWEGSWDDFRWVEAPAGHYFADPFLFTHEGQTWLFVEDFDYAANRGHLAAAPLDDDGRLGNWVTILDLPVHLSFPLIFRAGETIFLLPESGAGGSVDLYRCEHFPDRWVHAQVLSWVAGLDSVPIATEEGDWYFFSSVQEHSGDPPALSLFHAVGPRGPWIRHPASPLCCDIRFGRNGGRIIRRTDAEGLVHRYRISQDGAPRYGSRLHFHEIVELSPSHYREVLVGTRLPPAGRCGVHHYETNGVWEVIDASRSVVARRRPSPAALCLPRMEKSA